MNKTNLIFVGGLTAALGLAACTAGQTGPPTQTVVNPTQPGVSSLELSVGTANIAGSGLGMNVATSYRQKNGSSAVLVNTPKLTGPFTLPAAVVPDSPSAQYDANATADLGPSAAEVAGNFIGGSAASAQIGTAAKVTTTFGVNGGVFGNGFAPGNYGTSGLPGSFAPYYQPFYGGTNISAAGTLVATSNAFLPSGSAPAFDPAADGHGPTGANFPFNGLSLGLNAFAGVKPGAGTYTLNVSIQTIGSTLTQAPATATVANPAFVLPVATTGGVAPAATFNGDGTVTVTNVAIAAPVVGAYVEIIDYGATDTTTGSAVASCNGAKVSAPVFYTHWVTASGPVVFSNANAPEGQTTAVCTAAQNLAALGAATNPDTYTGDQIQIVVIGFDYNEYGLQYNGKTGSTYPQSPPLPAQADSSISLSAYPVSP